MTGKQFTLHYFDFHGGRGEVARLVMYMAGVPFNDNRIGFADWPAAKQTMPFLAVPVLEVNGEQISQSNAINRYLGKMADLYPSDPLQALRCDEVMDAVEDLVTKVVATFDMPDEERKLTRQQLCEGSFKQYLERFEFLLSQRGGEHFADSRLTVADLKVFIWLRSLRSGVLDHIPTDLADKYAPTLVQQFETIEHLPKVQSYYEQFQ